MKKTFFGAAALGIAGTFLFGGVADAGVRPTLKFDHNPVVAGQQVGVNGFCTENKPGAYKIVSEVLEPALVTQEEVDKSLRLVGNVTVKKDAKPGTYTASYTCDGSVVTAKLTVVAKEKKAPVETKTPAPAPKAGQVAEKPKGAAETGGGDVVAAPESTGPGAGVYALGGAALLATGGAGVFAFRRLRKES